MTPLRLLVGALVAAAIGIALIPLAVLLDLKEGGTGWGLCKDGLGSCRNSYFAGFEVIGGLMVALFAILLVIRLIGLLMRWLTRREEHKAMRSALAQTQQRGAAS